MDGMEEKMNAILNDPQMMGKIMAMAQSLSRPESGNPQAKESPPQKEEPAFSLPDIDPSMLQKLSGFMGQNRIDPNQQSLLHALTPYLSRDRIRKLEKAMRAARLARVASSFMGSSAFQSFLGR